MYSVLLGTILGSGFAGTTRRMGTRVRHVGWRGEQADTDQPHLLTAFTNTAQSTRVNSSSIPGTGTVSRPAIG
jgi:hypothetical protein